MVLYSCSRCHYSTKRKSNFSNHLNRKNKCQKQFSNVSIASLKKKYNIKNKQFRTNKIAENDYIKLASSKCNQSFSCEICQKSFKYRQNRWRHQKKCEKGKSILMVTEQKFKDMKLQIQEQQNQLDKLLEQQVQNNTIIEKVDSIDNSIDNSTTNNITINVYKNTNTSMITNKKIIELMNGTVDFIFTKLAQYIHFNPKYPENHNMVVLDDRTNNIYIKETDSW